MSKSLGTGVDPLELIDEHGADALRFGLLLMSSQQDVRFSAEKIRQGRSLVTKIWNATRLVITRGGTAGAAAPPAATTVADRWMVSRVTEAIELSADLIARYDFSRLADVIYHLVFDDYCDWYLELLKRGEATPGVAGDLLEQILALVHPVMPFVTEACWEQLPGSRGLMLIHPPPRIPGPRDPEAERLVAALQEAVTAVRAWRSRHGLSPRLALTVALDGLELGDLSPAFAGLANAGVGAVDGDAQVLALGAAQIRLSVPQGNVDRGAERARLESELRRVEAELGRAESMLANDRFVSRAPAGLVAAEREKVERFVAERTVLRDQIGALET
jgi:valyl-tRNA synthetase